MVIYVPVPTPNMNIPKNSNIDSNETAKQIQPTPVSTGLLLKTQILPNLFEK